MMMDGPDVQYNPEIELLIFMVSPMQEDLVFFLTRLDHERCESSDRLLMTSNR